MQILWTLLIGLIVGALARLVIPGKDRVGAAVTVILGVAGSFIAGMLGHSLGWYEVGDGPGLIASVIGAVVLLAIYRAVVGRRAAW